MEQAGCHVIYGLVGLKTHSKIALVVRREEEEIAAMCTLEQEITMIPPRSFIPTAVFLPVWSPWARTRLPCLTCFSGYSEPLSWNRLVLAPIWLRGKFMHLIERETAHARAGKEARIVAKMNSLCDEGIIAALYEASAAGVKIRSDREGDLLFKGWHSRCQ